MRSVHKTDTSLRKLTFTKYPEKPVGGDCLPRWFLRRYFLFFAGVSFYISLQYCPNFSIFIVKPIITFTLFGIGEVRKPRLPGGRSVNLFSESTISPVLPFLLWIRFRRGHLPLVKYSKDTTPDFRSRTRDFWMLVVCCLHLMHVSMNRGMIR